MAKHEPKCLSFSCSIEPGVSAYPIVIGPLGVGHRGVLDSFINGNQVLFVTNDTIAPLYLNKLMQDLSHKQVDFVVIPDGEIYKSIESAELIFDALLAGRHHRDTTIIALGGGVVGDLAGFVASTYQRGVALVHIPTTLLAQIDAAIGGKTAINYKQYKNMIGSFYHPKAVLIDPMYLCSLPSREFKAGLGELVKYAMLMGGTFLQTLQTHIKKIAHQPQSSELHDLIEACCRYKASVVAADPNEQGARALLNLGHTVAHALETLSENKRWLHGEAVAIGLYCAALLSYQLGLLSQEHLNLLDSLLQDCGLERRIPSDVSSDVLIDFMMMDKKVKNQQMRFVLMRAAGDCYLSDSVSIHDIKRMILSAVEGER